MSDAVVNRKIGRRCVRSGGPRGRPPRRHRPLSAAARRPVRRRRRRALPVGVRPQPQPVRRGIRAAGRGAARPGAAPPVRTGADQGGAAARGARRPRRLGRCDRDLRADLARTAAVGSGDGRPRGGGAAPLRRQADAREVAGQDQAGARRARRPPRSRAPRWARSPAAAPPSSTRPDSASWSAARRRCAKASRPRVNRR